MILALTENGCVLVTKLTVDQFRMLGLLPFNPVVLRCPLHRWEEAAALVDTEQGGRIEPAWMRPYARIT